MAAAQSGLSDARRELRERAIDAYIRQPSAQAVDLLLRVRTFRQLGAGSSFVSSVVREQADVVKQFEGIREEAEALQGAFESKRDIAREQRDVVAIERDAVANARAAQARIRASVAAEAARHETVLSEARRRKAEFEAQLRSLQRDSDSIGTLLRNSQKGQVFTGSGKGTFGVPLASARLTSNFGYRVHPIYKTRRLHTGADFGAPSGTPILAAGSGTVVYAGPRGGYGNVVIIDHGKALATLYAHQSTVLAGTGAKVAKGQVIGRVGSTGMSTGPHLHFEVRANGNPVDPLPYM